MRGVPTSLWRSAFDGAWSAFAQDLAAGKPVVDGALAGRKADTETIDHEIVAAYNRHQRQEASAAEPQADSPEIDGVACAVGYIDPQKAFS